MERTGTPSPPTMGPYGSQRRRCYVLEDSPIRVLGYGVPWEKDDNAEEIRVSREHLLGKLYESWYATGYTDSVARRRRNIWGMAQIARSGALTDDILFRLPRPGPSFTIRPTTRSAVPLQWVHTGRGVIPDTLADLSLATMSDARLLHLLNTVLDTNHQLRAYSTTGLLKCIRDTSHDFGEAYGKVRNWWWGSHSQSLQRGYYAMMRKREAKHDAFRRHVVQNFSLQRSTLPPRRIWDLYSNRVVPLVVLANSDTSSHELPDRLWTVSHSWVPEAEREFVWTPINGKQWPVPVPRATTLEHVRVELLNMGAEYVWLDVLCLRQRGRAADEALRVEEWKTDIPTIGHIYQGQPFRRPCITYFNGLGLPLDISQSTLASDRHWFSRVWTLQESLTTWLPGGLTGEALPDGDTFFAQLQTFPSLTLTSDDRLVRELMARHCTNELDRIAGLAYFLRCVSLPLYNAAMPVEHAWELLLKHASPAWRSSLLLRYPVDTPFAPYPSWKGYGATGPVLSATSVDSSLWLAEQSQLNTADPGHYYHFESTFGPYQIVCNGSQNAGRRRVKLDFCKDNAPVFSVSPLRMHGIILQGALYWLVRVSGDSCAYWVAVEVVAMHADEVTSDAVKWAALEVSYRADDWVEEYIRCFRRKIIYLPEYEARLRTKHFEQYMTAYGQMTANGKQSIIY